MPDVCFVLMPHALIEHPSIAIGILKGCLNQVNISSKAIYANLLFAEQIGLDRYKLLSKASRPEELLVEWTFSHLAFPDYQSNYQEYFDLLEVDPFFRNYLQEIRKEATIFVDKLAQDILEINPRIVSCSSTFQQNCASLAILRRIKTLNPEIVTLMGGANCEGIMGVTTHHEFPWLDFVASGEGEELFAPLCQLILEYGRDIPAELLPYGVIGPSERIEPRLVLCAPRATVKNLDIVPNPDYDDYFEALEKSSLKKFIQPGLLMETSRGCWWGQKSHCTFCGLNGNGLDYRAKSTQRVLDEMSQLKERYQINNIEVVDNILSNNHLETLIPTLAELDEPYNLFYETKANLKKHQVKQLAKAGVWWIQPGIESLHDEVLKLMGKGTTGAINIQLLKWGREFGVKIYWNMLVDFPMEDDQWYQEMAQWLPLLYHLEPPRSSLRVRFDRFSPYHENPAKYGIEIKPFPSYSYVYPLSPSAINDIAYFFMGSESTDVSSVRLNHAGPGLKTVMDSIVDWNQDFSSKKSAYLCQSELGGRVQIFDTRKCATERIFYLEGLSAAVYLACDRALSKTELLNCLSKDYQFDREWEEIESVLEELKERKILLEISKRYIALAVNGEVPSLIKDSFFPGGFVLSK